MGEDYTNPAQMPAEDLFRAMNRLGQTRTPFLFAVDYKAEEGILVPHPEEQTEIRYSIRGRGNMPLYTEPCKSASLRVYPRSFETYQGQFEQIRRALANGDSFLANLTIATRIETSCTLLSIAERADALYRLYVPGQFVCFSPERFVLIKPDKEGFYRIETNPMKGTIDATLPNARERILNDAKETAEHYTVVDLMRSDLARVGRNVRVDQFRYIDEIKTLKGSLLQVSSLISATLPPNAIDTLGTIISKLLPAGSITGAPKEATVKAIEEAETEPRGDYTGIFGYFDGTSLDSAVMIRFIEQKEDGTLLYHSGGGITINSRAEDEYREVIEKVYLPFT